MANESDMRGGQEGVEVLGQRKRGRPRKVRPGEGETPTTVVAPVVEDSTNPVALNAVEELDPATDEVIATYDDPMEVVELPDNPYPVTTHYETSGEPYVKAADWPAIGREIMAQVLAEAPRVPVPSQPHAVEDGWVDKADLTDAQIDALDHDYDGHPGGSRPKASLTEHQVAAFERDVHEAYQGQFEVKRTDAFNRVWSFRHEIVRNHDNMLVEAVRGPVVSRQHIPASLVTPERVMQAIRDADRETER